MAVMEKRNMENPDEVRKLRAHSHLDVVTLGDFTSAVGTNLRP